MLSKVATVIPPRPLARGSEDTHAVIQNKLLCMLFLDRHLHLFHVGAIRAKMDTGSDRPEKRLRVAGLERGYLGRLQEVADAGESHVLKGEARFDSPLTDKG